MPVEELLVACEVNDRDRRTCDVAELLEGVVARRVIPVPPAGRQGRGVRLVPLPDPSHPGAVLAQVSVSARPGLAMHPHAMLGYILSLGLFPVAETETWGFNVTVCDEGCRSTRFVVEDDAWSHLFLLPLLPVNRAWRVVTGGPERLGLEQVPGYMVQLIEELRGESPAPESGSPS